ncbi:MAG: hypothetical protein ACKVWV_14880 [Planctomycetota bacterium]
MKIHARLLSVLLALFASLAAGCAASSNQVVPFPPQDVALTRPDHTRIYFVRHDNAPLQKRALRVLEGDTEIGKLTAGTYLCWERPAGRTIARVFYEAVDPSRGNVDGIGDLDCAAGRVYFFNVEVGPEDGKPIISALTPDEGRELVARRKAAGE